jgi:hypothetical protein
MALHAFALFGWGRAITRALGLHVLAPALCAGVGLAWVICVGGVFNLAGWARPPSQWLVLGAGVVLGAPALRSLRRPAQLGLHTVLAVGALLGVGLMVCADPDASDR